MESNRRAIRLNYISHGNLVPGEFRPSDEYETIIGATTTFKIVADYGNGETAQQETQVKLVTYGTGTNRTPGSSEDQGGLWDNDPIFIKPEEFNLEGTLNSVFNQRARFNPR